MLKITLSNLTVKNHFVKNHFVKNNKVDQKISEKSFYQNNQWHFGAMPIALCFKPQELCGPQKYCGMQERTEEWLSVRLGQAR
jgi:hypothetical protein